MNLRVDLILETEKRSASVVNAKGLLRIVAIIVPITLAVIIAMSVMAMTRIRDELKALESEIAIAVPKKDAAITYRGELSKNKQILEELEGWRKSRINWADQLVNLQRVIPPEIQLTILRIANQVETIECSPSRTSSLVMKGKALGPQARADVELLGAVDKNAAFTNSMKTASVVSYTKNEEPSAKDGEMLFQIEASYKPRKFK